MGSFIKMCLFPCSLKGICTFNCLLYVSQGTKHIDPDSGLIYFKYDFGYEFGIILPGEGKRVDKLPSVTDGDDGVPFPVLHTKSTDEQREQPTAHPKGLQ